MCESDLEAQIAAAKAYAEFFVPGLCGDWALRVTAGAQIQTGNHVLDAVCDTGVLGREASSRVGSSAI
jgi:hypothetical protein